MTRRVRVSLNGKWNYVPDQYRGGEKRAYFVRTRPDMTAPGKDPVDHDMAGVATIPVPASWNMADPTLHYFEQQLWYYRTFRRPRMARGQRAFLCFEGSYYRTRAWLNEADLGPEHMGGFTPFEFEITRQLKAGENQLAVLVDAARDADRCPTTVTDWFTHGGLTRDVFIEVRPAKFVTSWYIQLDKRGRNLVGEVSATHGGTAVVSVPALGVEARVKIDAKRLTGKLSVPAPRKLVRWSTDNPKLYPVTVTFGDDVLADRVGFRTIEAKGGEVLLNGEPIFLKGISVHEDHVTRGRSLTDADREDIFREAGALGLNFLRLAHYPHSRRMAEMADRKGILLWEEIPVYWRILWTNPKTYADASNQLAELIRRDRNRAAVILWSVANETPPDVKGRTEFLANLARLARRLDPTRLTTAAQFHVREGGKLVISDPLAEHLDVLGVNQYGGWYGPRAQVDAMADFDNVHYPDKPVIVSEFGGGAKAGHRGREKFSEDYQALLYRRQLAAMNKARGIRGMTPWLLFDFRSPMRENRHQRGFNRKGLVAEDRRTRKLAFEVYRRFRPKT
ncbi:MAG: Beta-glucuronidase [Phycisphaerae bacterium]|nr:Beta-glucuronidase [Phycisphaerae bacterium]